jgi:predicted dehydrogenase
MGAGGIAHSFAQALRVCDGAELIAIASKDKERALNWCSQEHYTENEITVYGEYPSFLNDQRIDVVYIATTVNFHEENVKAALLAGKHVICEKSMVETLAQAKELFTLAHDKHLFLMEAMWSRFLPRTKEIQHWIKSGKIGDVRLIQASVGFVAPKQTESRLYAPSLGGGSMYDIGIYIIDMLPYLVNRNIVDVKAQVIRASTGIDETVQIMMQLEGGVLANGQISFDAKLPEDVYLYGNKGYIRAPHVHWGMDAYCYDEKENLVEEFHPQNPLPGFAYEINEVLWCINNKRETSLIAPPEMTYASSRIFETVLQTENNIEFV